MSAANTLVSLVQNSPAQIVSNAKGPLSTATTVLSNPAVGVATIPLASATTAPPATGEAPVVFLIAATAEAEVRLHRLCCLACNACRQHQGLLCICAAGVQAWPFCPTSLCCHSALHCTQSPSKGP